jgi:ABC-2 type transport system permease protein
MSTATAIVESPPARLGADERPRFARLVGVELRKMVDTRAGFWLPILTLPLMGGLVALSVAFGEDVDSRFNDMFWSALWPASMLLPIMGILLVTSEWTQRTSLITFTLIPRRERVIAAKIGAGIVLSLTALIVSLPMAVVGTVIASPGIEGTWSMPPEMLGQAAVYVSAAMIVGLAFGMVLLVPAPAIVLYFGLPLVWASLSTIPGLHGVGRWLDSLSPWRRWPSTRWTPPNGPTPGRPSPCGWGCPCSSACGASHGRRCSDDRHGTTASRAYFRRRPRGLTRLAKDRYSTSSTASFILWATSVERSSRSRSSGGLPTSEKTTALKALESRM